MEQRLITPTSSCITIIQTAHEVLKKIYREGYQYKKADVFANAIKHDFRSPNPTTRWSDVIQLNSNAKKRKP